MAEPSPVYLDVIIPSGPSYAEMTPREAHVREATIVLTFFAPLAAAAFCLLSSSHWWTHKKIWSFRGVAALWFVSISIFNAVLFAKGGVADRTTFIVAGLYGNVQVLLLGLLLNVPAARSLAFVWLWGIVHSSLTILLSDIKTVFITTSTLVTTNALLIASLLFYGKQFGFGIAGVAHLVSTVTIFTGIVRNFGIVSYNAIQLFALGFQIVLVVGGILNASAHDDHLDQDQAFRSPLQTVNVPENTFIGTAAFSFVVSVIVTLLLTHVVA